MVLRKLPDDLGRVLWTNEGFQRRAVPARVVITEYVDVARAFFAADERGLVNGLLDTVARADCPVILMHSPDPTTGGHGKVRYDDVLVDVFEWLEARVEAVALVAA